MDEPINADNFLPNNLSRILTKSTANGGKVGFGVALFPLAFLLD